VAQTAVKQKPIDPNEWEDINSDWEDVTPPTPVTTAPEQGFFSKAWHMLADPIAPVVNAARAKGQEWTNSATGKDPWLDSIKGFGAGALEGAADLVTPLNLATAAFGGAEFAAGKAGLGSIARLASVGNKVSGIPTAIHGASQVLDPEASFGDRAIGVAEAVGGTLPFLHTPKPTINPNIAESVLGDLPLHEPNIMPEFQKSQGFDPLQNAPESPRTGSFFDPTQTAPNAQTLPVATATPKFEAPSELDELTKSLNIDPNSLEIKDPNINAINGSGESSASLEAINRVNGMKSNGQQYVVYDKAGNRKPIIGVDAVDYHAQPGETYGIEGPNGFQLLEDNGGLHPDRIKAKIAAIQKNVTAKGSASESTTKLLDDLHSKLGIESTTNQATGKPIEVKQSSNDPTAVWIKNPDPAVIKQVMQRGYVFDSLRDDGAFKMVKSDKPVNLPILEQEVGLSRPTPAKAARMAGGNEPPSIPPEQRMSDGGNEPIPPVGKHAPTKLMEAFNFPRAVMASMDFSAPLRQGLPLIHKKQFWTSLDDMFKAWGSEKAFKAIQQDILDKPLFRARATPTGTAIKSFAEDAGLKLTDLNSLSGREEHIMSTWAEKIPGVRRSNRAYTAFLNKLRADTFEDLIKQSKVLGADGNTNLPLARALADFVNTASGRGSLGKLEKSAVALNTALFSPRLIASRLKMLNPAYYIMADPTVRKEALKSLLAVAAAGSTVTQLGKMAGGTVESDPTNSDFGKLKIGNVRLDPNGGFQQYVVAASRLLSGKSTSSSSGKEYDLWNKKGPFDPTSFDVIKNFGVSKLHPVFGFAYALLNGQKEMTGQKMNFTTTNPMDNAVAQRFIPIVVQDIYQLMQEDPTLLPLLGPLTSLGMSTQIYGGKK